MIARINPKIIISFPDQPLATKNSWFLFKISKSGCVTAKENSDRTICNFFGTVNLNFLKEIIFTIFSALSIRRALNFLLDQH